LYHFSLIINDLAPGMHLLVLLHPFGRDLCVEDLEGSQVRHIFQDFQVADLGIVEL